MTPQQYYTQKASKLAYAAERLAQRKNINEIDFSKIKNIHIIGICGTLMASIASLLIKKGFIVTGSDKACYAPMSDILKELNIETLPFDIKNLENKDLYIIGNVCAPNNIEAAHLREEKKPYFSVGEIINHFFIEDKTSIVIAGTHGKTTTTSLAISTVENASYLVGGVVKEKNNSSFYDKTSKYFIIEGDEYDTAYFDKRPKFLHYKPNITVITSIELDHIDIYNDLEDYKQAFKYLIEETKDCIIACIDDENVKVLIKEYQEKYKDIKKIITYGFSDNADIKIEKIINDKEGQEIYLKYNSKKDDFKINMFGEYNALNAVAIYAVQRFLNLDINNFKTKIQNFQGAKRRQEVFAIKNNITIIDDFAHHPTAVYKTLKGMRERFSDKNIIAIFEPRSNSSRAKMFENEYIESFDFANKVYISSPTEKKEGYNPENFIDIKYIENEINKKGIYCKALHNADEIIDEIKGKLKEGDILVVMSNGDFDNIHNKLLNTC